MKSIRVKNATTTQLNQARCKVCGELVTKRGWITIYPTWIGQPTHGKCLP